jgi:nicotinamide-nucleotide amidase
VSRREDALTAEVIGVGTELLLGQIANTNAQHISSALADIGVDVYFHSVVGDNLERVTTALDVASRRARVLIVTGGLGPTPDDLTREAVAAWLGVPLVRDDRLVDVITGIFEEMGRRMSDTNLKQADLPLGARAIDPVGTAPGFIVEADGVGIAALPGVPWEMKDMLASDVIPWLTSKSARAVIRSHQVVVLGLGESLTHERIADLVAAQGNPTIAYLAGAGRVRVRITAKGATEHEAEALIAPVEAAVRSRLGDAALPVGVESLAAALGRTLTERGESCAVAESLTGGLLGAELSETPGSSAYFLGSLVCYSTEAKRVLAGVDDAIVDGPGVVSEPAARALAEAAVERFAADLGLSATGVAGPDPQEGKPPGTVFVGAAYRGRSQATLVRARGDRANIKAFAVTAALNLGRRMLAER